jgi:site-specific DNA-methyltransferase (adenine-specific)
MTNKIFNKDILEVASSIPENSCHLCISDPPYNIGKDFGNTSDRLSFDNYVEFSRLWIRECVRALHPQGTLFIYGLAPINWFMWGILREYCDNPTKQLKELVWYYTNKQVPRMNFYRPAHETIMVYFKDKDVHTFNEDVVREPYETDYAKFAGKTRPKGKGRFGEEESIYNVHPDGALPRDVIKVGTLAGGNGKERIIGDGSVKHPTQKPKKLTQKLILGSTNEQDIVLVPFAGSGTECLMSYGLNRRFIGAEINPDYIKLTHQRFLDEGIIKLRLTKNYLKVG